jgi:hypothetical protein
MAKRAWNPFTTKHPAATGFTASVSAKLPGGVRFDTNGKVLPTPYRLACEWIAPLLSGDWTSKTMKGGFIVKLADAADIAVLRSMTNATVPLNQWQFGGCAVVYRLAYTDSDYANVARSVGYAV